MKRRRRRGGKEYFIFKQSNHVRSFTPPPFFFPSALPGVPIVFLLVLSIPFFFPSQYLSLVPSPFFSPLFFSLSSYIRARISFSTDFIFLCLPLLRHSLLSLSLPFSYLSLSLSVLSLLFIFLFCYILSSLSLRASYLFSPSFSIFTFSSLATFFPSVFLRISLSPFLP